MADQRRDVLLFSLVVSYPLGIEQRVHSFEPPIKVDGGARVNEGNTVEIDGAAIMRLFHPGMFDGALLALVEFQVQCIPGMHRATFQFKDIGKHMQVTWDAYVKALEENYGQGLRAGQDARADAP